jgi:hypothetical protein
MTDILDKLLERTRAARISWKPTADEGTFVALVGELSIVIDMDWRGIGPDMPTLRIVNKNGRVVDWINVDTQEGRVHKEDLDHLHLMARRTALGTDHELDQLLAALDADP